MPPEIFIAAVVLAVVAVWLVLRMQESRRVEACKLVAQRLGLEFHEGGDEHLRHPFKIFTDARDPVVNFRLEGLNQDVKVTVLDYEYSRAAGEKDTRRVTLCIVACRALALPHLFLRPQRAVYDWLGKLFGGQDIDFAEDPVFSPAFVLQGEDEPAVRRVCDARVRQAFSRLRESNLFFEGRGDSFVMHRDKRLEPAEIAAFIRQAMELRRAFGGEQPLLHPGDA